MTRHAQGRRRVRHEFAGIWIRVAVLALDVKKKVLLVTERDRLDGPRRYGRRRSLGTKSHTCQEQRDRTREQAHGQVRGCGSRCCLHEPRTANREPESYGLSAVSVTWAVIVSPLVLSVARFTCVGSPIVRAAHPRSCWPTLDESIHPGSPTRRRRRADGSNEELKPARLTPRLESRR
jgi:hypothetical protein